MLLVVGLATASLALPGAAFGYDGAAASTWAQNHWQKGACSATGSYPCFDTDCANFVSFAMSSGGGYDEEFGNGDELNPSLWFSNKNGLNIWSISRTWSLVPRLYDYLIAYDEPGGYLLGYANGTATYSYTGLAVGDLLFWDWEGNGTYTHVNMKTKVGKDPTFNPNQIADQVTQHTPDRLNQFWSLYEHNQQRNLTKIKLVGISASN